MKSLIPGRNILAHSGVVSFAEDGQDGVEAPVGHLNLVRFLGKWRYVVKLSLGETVGQPQSHTEPLDQCSNQLTCSWDEPKQKKMIDLFRLFSRFFDYPHLYLGSQKIEFSENFLRVLSVFRAF